MAIFEDAGTTGYRLRPGATGVGWDLAFHGMAMHLESGAAVDASAFLAWMTSDEGKETIRGCAEAWGQAHLLAGEDPVVAAEMAAATAAFYTGG